MTMLNGESAFHAYGLASFTRVLGMSSQEAEEICNAAVESMSNRDCHLYFMKYDSPWFCRVCH